MLKVLNLRNVPEELMRELKAAAALADEPFHPFCVALIKAGLLHWRVSQPGYPFIPLEDHVAPTYGGIQRTAAPESPASPTPEPPQEIEIT